MNFPHRYPAYPLIQREISLQLQLLIYMRMEKESMLFCMVVSRNTPNELFVKDISVTIREAEMMCVLSKTIYS